MQFDLVVTFIGLPRISRTSRISGELGQKWKVESISYFVIDSDFKALHHDFGLWSRLSFKLSDLSHRRKAKVQ
jgi:hypothetical protein